MAISTNAIGAVLLALCIGIIPASLVQGPLVIGIVGVVLASMCFLWWRIKKHHIFLTSALLLSVVAIGAFRVGTLHPVRVLEVDGILGVSTEVIGVISRDPDRRPASVHYVFDIERVGEYSISGPTRVLAYLDRYPEYALGDRLVLSGILELPENFDTDPDRPPFPYVAYLAKDGIGYLMKFPDVLAVSNDDAHPVLSRLSIWKQNILAEGIRIFPEPEGGLIAGVLLGEKRALPASILDDMRVAGLIHIIVVSGYNMTIVAEGVAKLFTRIPVIGRSTIGILFIWLYAGLVGGGAPVIRASIMTSLALVARMTGNTANALRLLVLAVGGMVLLNPRIVLDDPSFHLSFLATLGLIVLSPHIEKWLPGQTRGLGKDLLSSTLSAQLMVIPYILFFSGQLSPYALLANLLALPFIPLTMALGAVALFFSSLFSPIGPVLGDIASLPASWVLASGAWVASLPGSDTVLPIPLVGSLLLYVAGFVVFRKMGWGNTTHVSVKKEYQHDRNS